MVKWWFDKMSAKTLGQESDLFVPLTLGGVYKSFDESPLRGKSSLVYHYLEDIMLP